MLLFFLDHIMPWAVLVPLACGWLFYRQLPAGVRYILLYTCTAAVFNLLADYLTERYNNNMPVFHLYAVLEFTCCTLFFRTVFAGTRLARFLPAVIFLFIALSAYNALFVQDIFSFNSYPRTIASVTIIVLCLLHMYRTLGRREEEAGGRPSLTISLGLLLYFSGSLFLFLFSHYLLESRLAVELGWSIHATLVLAMYLFFAVAFYQSRRA